MLDDLFVFLTMSFTLVCNRFTSQIPYLSLPTLYVDSQYRIAELQWVFRM